MKKIIIIVAVVIVIALVAFFAISGSNKNGTKTYNGGESSNLYITYDYRGFTFEEKYRNYRGIQTRAKVLEVLSLAVKDKDENTSDEVVISFSSKSLNYTTSTNVSDFRKAIAYVETVADDKDFDISTSYVSSPSTMYLIIKER